MSTDKNRQKARKKLRQDLLRRGVPESEIEDAVERFRQWQITQEPGPAQPPSGKKKPISMQEVKVLAEARDLALLDPELRARLDLLRAEREGALKEHAARLYAEQPEQPDDARHKPTWIDPVLRGQARATGATADAVKRGRTIRRADYDDRETA